MGGAQAKPLPDPCLIGDAMEAVKVYYDGKVAPVEERHLFADFYGPPLDGPELRAKPTVLICGQYSVGKTSMISYILDAEYPGARVGPEPTTDVFVFVQHAEGPGRSVPGPALISETNFPFKSLGRFGHEFVNRMQGATADADILKNVMLIDTPGILSGEKQRVSRGYEFHEVVRFLADKVDRIWILFDTAKMDISDEFKLVIQRLEDNVDKVRIILNKADDVPADELVRVRGALMWNLGKILAAPEIPQVYLGSFWDQPLKRTELKNAFLHDYLALLNDVQDLRNGAATRKINDVVKRAKKAQVHAYIMNRMLTEHRAGGFRSRKKTIKYWTANSFRMRKLFWHCEVRDKVPKADFPDPDEFILATQRSEFKNWAKIKPRQMAALKVFLDKVPWLLSEMGAKGRTVEDVGEILALLGPEETAAAAKVVGNAASTVGDVAQGTLHSAPRDGGSKAELLPSPGAGAATGKGLTTAVSSPTIDNFDWSMYSRKPAPTKTPLRPNPPPPASPVAKHNAK